MAFIDDEGRRVREELPLEGARAIIAENMLNSKRNFHKARVLPNSTSQN